MTPPFLRASKPNTMLAALAGKTLLLEADAKPPLFGFSPPAMGASNVVPSAGCSSCHSRSNTTCRAVTM